MNPENQAETETNPEDKTLITVADPSLTMAAKKLAGSANCLNCGTVLQGPFCYYCGQPDRNFMRFFPAMLRDLMADLLDLDSRFMRTIKPLLFKPGRLTRDYMDGRRFRYAPPMRLYIFSSILFFLLAAFLSSDAMSIDGGENADDMVHFSTGSAEEQQNAEQTLNNIIPHVPDQIDQEQALTEISNKKKDPSWFKTDDFQFNDEPWNRETNPVDIKWLPDWINKRINDEIEGSPQKAQQINENPSLIIDKVFDILPATMFILLPVVALILKFWYLFAKRYYLEHLIFSLHNHAFIFVSFILLLLAGVTGELLSAYEYTTAAKVTEGLNTVISIWIPVYMLISLRVVYQQNWWLTIGKFCVIGICYMTLLILVTTMVAITSFVLL